MHRILQSFAYLDSIDAKNFNRRSLGYLTCCQSDEYLHVGLNRPARFSILARAVLGTPGPLIFTHWLRHSILISGFAGRSLVFLATRFTIFAVGYAVLAMNHIAFQLTYHAPDRRGIAAFRADRLFILVRDGLQTDGSHHKQWFLEEIGKCVGLNPSEIDHDEGIAP